ncbi:MAG: phosphotransferase [Thiohalocapsa sp.]|uniref:aminoglycoside phosphotransferase family protein n=1 Tax=Thiohalocapsa sp. TaxID=2497641 RepID=UPI0025E336BE|nr:phosphotransferase [Thiohalocapsa sp.]MCG6942226.1 phosphotransferase [Thiohalocapsa sp.]
MSERGELFQEWLTAHLGGEPPALVAASTDASFRRYWRLRHGAGTVIAVDAPPDTEDSTAFVRLARAFGAIGLNVPQILAEDLERGFLLVADLGERQYLDHLDAANADRLYGDAIAALIALQAAGPQTGLPLYDEPFLRRELGIFDQWLLDGLLALPRAEQLRPMLEISYDLLVESALAQPRVCVHRDFHSRNLMFTEQANPGILDFQDAVLGPVTYDLVSLLRDCYIDWPEARVQAWQGAYLDLALRRGILHQEHVAAFTGWFDLMGVQRHLKAAGIFARLALRDGRPDYLRYLPRTLGYVRQVCARYPALEPLADFVSGRVLPAVAAHLPA